MDVTEDQVRDTADNQLAETERQLKMKTQWTRGVKRALLVVCVFFVFQQITGINIPFYYGPELLWGYLGSANSSAVDAAVAGVEAASILATVNVIATFFAFRYIGKVGRRKLAIGGYAGMAVFILVVALGVAHLTGLPRVWVAMIGFSFFITSFAIGAGGTGWLIQGEVFPKAVRGRTAAVGASSWTVIRSTTTSVPGGPTRTTPRSSGDPLTANRTSRRVCRESNSTSALDFWGAKCSAIT
jgi:SP family arabinose:H+ symporter-like MFS transporter